MVSPLKAWYDHSSTVRVSVAGMRVPKMAISPYAPLQTEQDAFVAEDYANEWTATPVTASLGKRTEKRLVYIGDDGISIGNSVPHAALGDAGVAVLTDHTYRYMARFNDEGLGNASWQYPGYREYATYTPMLVQMQQHAARYVWENTGAPDVAFPIEAYIKRMCAAAGLPETGGPMNLFKGGANQAWGALVTPAALLTPPAGSLRLVLPINHTYYETWGFGAVDPWRHFFVTLDIPTPVGLEGLKALILGFPSADIFGHSMSTVPATRVTTVPRITGGYGDEAWYHILKEQGRTSILSATLPGTWPTSNPDKTFYVASPEDDVPLVSAFRLAPGGRPGHGFALLDAYVLGIPDYVHQYSIHGPVTVDPLTGMDITIDAQRVTATWPASMLAAGVGTDGMTAAEIAELATTTVTTVQNKTAIVVPLNLLNRLDLYDDAQDAGVNLAEEMMIKADPDRPDLPALTFGKAELNARGRHVFTYHQLQSQIIDDDNSSVTLVGTYNTNSTWSATLKTSGVVVTNPTAEDVSEAISAGAPITWAMTGGTALNIKEVVQYLYDIDVDTVVQRAKARKMRDEFDEPAMFVAKRPDVLALPDNQQAAFWLLQFARQRDQLTSTWTGALAHAAMAMKRITKT